MTVGILSGVIIKGALDKLLPIFMVDTGISVDVRYDLNPAVKTRIQSGETFHAVITNPHFLDELISAGLVAKASYVDIGSVGMGLAIHENAQQPSLNSVDEFKEFLRSAPTIAYTAEGTSGKTFKAVLFNLGILDEIANRLVPVVSGQSSRDIMSGAVAVAVLPKSNILAGPGMKLAGMFPSALQSRIDLGAAISLEVTDNEEPQKLLRFLAGPKSDDILAKCGVDRMS